MENCFCLSVLSRFSPYQHCADTCTNITHAGLEVAKLDNCSCPSKNVSSKYGKKISTDREAREGDLHVGADEVLLLAPEHVLEVGHDGGVHPREAVSSVHPHQELGPLPLRRDAHRDQQVPAENI